MTSLIHALNLALLHFVWQAALIASLLWMALAGMRRRSANARYLVSCAALGALVLAPAITTFWIYQRPRASAMEAASAGAPVFLQFSAKGVHWSALETWALPLWSLGVALFSLRLLWGARSVAAMRRRGLPAEERICAAVARLAERMGVQRAVRVLMSELADGPSVIGLVKPAILLPVAAISGLAPDQLEAVLAHELAHIRRHDYLVNVAQMLVEALLFYHPAVWWISSRIRMERELCCDDSAVLACGDGLRYARALTMLERLRVSAPALGAMDGPLAYRIKRLMGVVAEESETSKIAGAVALCAALALLGVSVARLHGQVQPDAPGVHVDLGSSAVIHRTPVQYPAAAQTKNVQGTITVELRLDSSGNVTDAHVLSGPDELRKTVLQSVLGWHFTPQSASSTKVVNVQFQTPAPKEVVNAAPVPNSDDRAAQNEKAPEFLRSELTRLDALARAKEEQIDQNLDVLRGREEAERRLADLQARLTATQAELVAAQIAERIQKAQNLEGRTVRSIRLVGLGISLEDFLAQAQLPLRVGDTLTQSSIEAATAAIAKFDEHLQVGWVHTDSNSVDLTIVAPGVRVPGGRGGRGGAAPPEPPQPPEAPQAGAYRIGDGVSAPVPVYQPQPEYTEEAKNAKWQGTVGLSLVVDESGKAVNIKVTKSLGLGLDQKAIEAIEKWQFKPGTKDGQPVPVLANIEVNFRLL